METEELFWQLENAVRRNPECIKGLTKRWKYLQELATNTNRLNKLTAVWSDMPPEVIEELNTNQSAPFVTLMLGLVKRKYKVSQVSMVMWWRRLVSIGQDHIISYFSWTRLDELINANGTSHHKDVLLTSQDLMRVCVSNSEMLSNITHALTSNQTVDFKIRELLGGLSKQSDVKKAWRDWAKINHPDKGGDSETFLRVKLVYDEWLTTQPKTQE